MALIVPACLLFGVGIVTSVQHGAARASSLDPAIVFVIVVDLLGLGLLIVSSLR